MREFRKDIRGRGAGAQIPNRFEKTHYEPEAQEWDGYLEDHRPLLRTEFIPDASKTIVTKNNSPDLGFEYSVNPYRGCEHGCAYCYARPTHEYLGFSAGLDFESKILFKEKAPELLREKLMSRSWEPATIFMSGVTDCYQPIERKMKLTRGCLEVLAQFRNPVALITKNAMVTRDLDLFAELAKYNAAMVYLSVTTLDEDLCAKLEPRTSRPQARLRAIEELAKAGVPVGVNVAPCIPGLTDHEMPAILKAAKEAGASFAGYVPVRLPLTVVPVFTEWLQAHRPERKDRVIHAIQGIRDGKMNDARFGTRMRGEGPVADAMAAMFRISVKKLGLNEDDFELSGAHFVRPGDQLSLFDSEDSGL